MKGREALPEDEQTGEIISILRFWSERLWKYSPSYPHILYRDDPGEAAPSTVWLAQEAVASPLPEGLTVGHVPRS
jgi:hypothetical protein